MPALSTVYHLPTAYYQGIRRSTCSTYIRTWSILKLNARFVSYVC